MPTRRHRFRFMWIGVAFVAFVALHLAVVVALNVLYDHSRVVGEVTLVGATVVRAEGDTLYVVPSGREFEVRYMLLTHDGFATYLVSSRIVYAYASEVCGIAESFVDGGAAVMRVRVIKDGCELSAILRIDGGAYLTYERVPLPIYVGDYWLRDTVVVVVAASDGATDVQTVARPVAEVSYVPWKALLYNILLLMLAFAIWWLTYWVDFFRDL